MFGLSIIIVNYKSEELISNCLKSIYKFGFDHDFEIIIIDNESNEYSRIAITTSFPEIIWHDMKYNSGFSRANNQGIKLAKYDHVLLLNPDTIIVDNAINKCFAEFIKSNHIACGVQLLNPDSSFQISGSNFFFGGLNYILPIPYLGSFFKFLGSLLNFKPPHVKKATSINSVEWINGAFLMVKKSIIKDAGMMDENFFLYGEEIEWCSRLNKYGSLAIFGDEFVIHFVSGSIQTTTKSSDNSYSNLFDTKGLQILVSNQLLILKKFGLFWFFFHLLVHTIGMILNLILIPFESLYTKRKFKYLFNRAKNYANNVIQIWKLLPKYLSNSGYFFKAI
jgi:hypothetical protein